MDTKFKEMMHEVTHFMQNEATTKTVVGEPFKLGEFHCIPVIRVGMGFGTGVGERDLKNKGHGEGVASGAGMGIEPIEFLTSNKQEIQFISTTSNSALTKAFEKAPELINKFLETRKFESAHN